MLPHRVMFACTVCARDFLWYGSDSESEPRPQPGTYLLTRLTQWQLTFLRPLTLLAIRAPACLFPCVAKLSIAGHTRAMCICVGAGKDAREKMLS